MDWASEAFHRELRDKLRHLRWFRALPEYLRQDIIQDTALKLLSSGANPQKPLAYAVTVARNLAATQMRREKIYALEVAGDFPSNSSNPEQLASELEETAQALSRLSRLPERQKMVVRLILQAGYQVADVATTLAINENTVRQHLSRALRSLAHEIDEQEVTKLDPEQSSK